MLIVCHVAESQLWSVFRSKTSSVSPLLSCGNYCVRKDTFSKNTWRAPREPVLMFAITILAVSPGRKITPYLTNNDQPSQIPCLLVGIRTHRYLVGCGPGNLHSISDSQVPNIRQGRLEGKHCLDSLPGYQEMGMFLKLRTVQLQWWNGYSQCLFRGQKGEPSLPCTHGKADRIHPNISHKAGDNLTKIHNGKGHLGRGGVLVRKTDWLTKIDAQASCGNSILAHVLQGPLSPGVLSHLESSPSLVHNVFQASLLGAGKVLSACVLLESF